MRSLALLAALLALAATLQAAPPALAAAAAPKPAPGPLTGIYESGWNKVPSLELVVAQQGPQLRAGLTLVADHRGTRVLTVDLKGKTAGRAAHFRWKDAYGNEGTATLWPRGPGAWRLDAIIRKPTDQGRWFEGHYDLTKTADKLEPGQEPSE